MTNDWGLYPSPPEPSGRQEREEEEHRNEIFDEICEALVRVISKCDAGDAIQIASAITGMLDDGQIPHVTIDY